ncbi:MAG: hypothetical protein HYZ10_16165 [Ignavibacteriales bacterium]|nr:hypothetical protein [Ignavibacteriales bacterium]
MTRNKILIIVLGFMLVLAYGCVDKAIEPVTDSLEENYTRWKSLGISDYSMTQSQLCFCVYGGDKMIVLVRNNKIVSVQDSAGVIQVPQEHWQWFKTVDQLFETAIKAKNDKPNSFQVQFNNEYGFPEYLWVDPIAQAADEEYGYTTRSFKPLK